MNCAGLHLNYMDKIIIKVLGMLGEFSLYTKYN